MSCSDICFLPKDVLRLILCKLDKDGLFAVIRAIRAFYNVYRTMVPNTPIKLPKSLGPRDNPRHPGGRRRGENLMWLLVCNGGDCKSKGDIIDTFHGQEHYDDVYRSYRFTHYDTTSLNCPRCNTLGTLKNPEYQMNRHDDWIRSGECPEYMIRRVLYGIDGFSRDISYQKCGIAKYIVNAQFDDSGRPKNVNARRVTRYRFVAAISRARSFVERLAAYEKYARALCPEHELAKQVADHPPASLAAAL
jgi:hypothetical protein